MVESADLAALGAGLVSATFFASGAAKLRRPFVPALALVRFGLVQRIRSRYGLVAGAVELVAAVSLAVGSGSPYGFAPALALGPFFVAIVGRALWAGKDFDCGCFGEGDRVSLDTLARAVGLTLIALVCAGLAATAHPIEFDRRLTDLAIGASVLTALSLSFALRSYRPFRVGVEPSAPTEDTA